ncbi:MAG: hypothetical protein PUE67_02910 [Oscillospiraceae bacterium]|nr:hypothetical protein [Oscillospiraceae bacterium]
MKKRIFKSGLSVLLSLTILVSTVAVMTGCNDEEEQTYNYGKVTYEPYDEKSDDRFNFTADAITSAIVDKIKGEAVSQGKKLANKLGTKLVTKAERWVQNNIFDSLGITVFNFEKGISTADIYNQITDVKKQIGALNDEVKKISSQLNDNRYSDQYINIFLPSYNGAFKYKTLFNNLKNTNDTVGTDGFDKKNFIEDISGVEDSIRGEANEKGVRPVSLKTPTDVYTSAMDLGRAILGTENSTDDVPHSLQTYSIFSIVRHFVEAETPWDIQRKNYEDSYISSIILTYESLYSIVMFDLSYNLDKLGVEEMVIAHDGTVLGFTLGGKKYFNFYKNRYEELSKKYDSEFKENNLNTDSYIYPTSGNMNANARTSIDYLCGYFQQQYDLNTAIYSVYDSFTRNKTDNTYNLDLGGGNERKLSGEMNTIHIADFILKAYSDSKKVGGMRSINCDVDFDKFSYVSKDDFDKFVSSIKDAAGSMSFYDYLRSVGIVIPTDENAPVGYKHLLALAVVKNDNDETYDKNRKCDISHCDIIYVDLDMKVSDYNSSKVKRITIYHHQKQAGGCDNKWKFSPGDYLVGVRESKRYQTNIGNTKYQYKDLNLISWSGLASKQHKSGTVNYAKISGSW